MGREANYDSVINFYQCLDSEGSILDSYGKVLKPFDVGYANAAQRPDNLITGLSNLQLVNYGTSRQAFAIAGGAYAAPVARVYDGTRVNTYFAFAHASDDKEIHFKNLGNGLLGFEDMHNLGDRDFNDNIINFNFQSVL